MMFAVAGCGGGGSGSGSGGGSGALASHRMHGVMHGGQNPVAGATVTLYAAGDTGYGSAPIATLGTTTTDKNGKFTIDTFTCPSNITSGARIGTKSASRENGVTPLGAGTNGGISPETYLVATGGDSGSGENDAIAMMAAIGPCSEIQDSTTVQINELTTIAAQWALQQFADASGKNIGTPVSNLGGLSNAYTTIANLVDVSSSDFSVSGNPSSFLPTAAQCGAGSPPVNCDGLERLNTLADIVASCVNSGPGSTPCATLLCDAIPGAIYSGGICSEAVAPMIVRPAIPSMAVTPLTDTLAAAHSIAQNPTNNPGPLFDLATPNAPFEPSLAFTPDGWEIALNFAPTNAAFDAPIALAIDGGDNVFAANCGSGCTMTGSSSGSVSELPVTNGYASGFNFNPSGADFDAPTALALDSANNVFVTNGAGGSVSELTAISTYTSGLNYNPSLDDPRSIALDGSSNLFVTSGTALNHDNAVVEFLAPTYSGFSVFAPLAPRFSDPTSIALDTSANVFVVNLTENDVSELFEGDMGFGNYGSGTHYDTPTAAFNGANALVLDGKGNVFVTNAAGSVSELTQLSSYASGDNFSPDGAAFSFPSGLALDGSGDIFVANLEGNSVSELTSASSYGSGINLAPPGAAFDFPGSPAVDRSGNVFVPNAQNNSISQLIGLATPVMTPIQECGFQEKLHSSQYCLP